MGAFSCGRVTFACLCHHAWHWSQPWRVVSAFSRLMGSAWRTSLIILAMQFEWTCSLLSGHEFHMFICGYPPRTAALGFKHKTQKLPLNLIANPVWERNQLWLSQERFVALPGQKICRYKKNSKYFIGTQTRPFPSPFLPFLLTYIFTYAFLWMEPRAPDMLGKCSPNVSHLPGPRP